MRYVAERAQALHQRLTDAIDAADEGQHWLGVVRAVVELHAPNETLAYGSYASCAGCVGSIQGDSPAWPEDCTTTEVVARGLGVDLS